MKMEARFRRRASLDEGIETLNARILSNLLKIGDLWDDSRGASDIILDTGSGESAGVDLSPCLRACYEGAIMYASRASMPMLDKAICDDSLVIQFDADAVDISLFCHNVFPEIVKAFSPYRAALIVDLEKDLDDFEDIVEEVRRTGKDVDGRDTVFRFNLINYFDQELCLRAFGTDAQKIVEKLSGSIALSEYFESGAYLVLGDSLVLGDAMIALEEKVRKLLEL